MRAGSGAEHVQGSGCWRRHGRDDSATGGSGIEEIWPRRSSGGWSTCASSSGQSALRSRAVSLAARAILSKGVHDGELTAAKELAVHRLDSEVSRFEGVE